MDDRIPTELWAAGQIRRLNTLGIPAYVLRKGAPAGGTVIVNMAVRGQGCRVLSQSRDMDGKLGWLDVFEGMLVDEKRASEYIQRAASRDPDIWVLEIETKTADAPFEEKII